MPGPLAAQDILALNGRRTILGGTQCCAAGSIGSSGSCAFAASTVSRAILCDSPERSCATSCSVAGLGPTIIPQCRFVSTLRNELVQRLLHRVFTFALEKESRLKGIKVVLQVAEEK